MKKLKWRGSAGPVLGLCLCLVAVPEAFAQESGPQETGTQETVGEIVVRAQRREENLQSVPVAVTAFDAAALEERGIESLRDVTDYVPNLMIESTVGVQGSARVFLRGIGQDDLNSESPIALYVDDVYLGSQPGTMIDLYEIAGLEVLRGPQGTLYGRNSNGGAIRITTRRPGPELSALGEFSVGTFGELGGRGRIEGPLAPGLSAQAAFVVRTHDGYSTVVDDANPFTPASALAGNRANAQDTVAGRLALSYNSGGLDIMLSGDVVRDRSDPFLATALDDGRSGFGAGDFDGTNPENPDNDIFTLETNLGSNTAFPDLSFFPFTAASDMEVIAVQPPLNQIDTRSVALNIGYDFDAFTIRSITALRSTEHEVYTDLDGQQAHKFAIYQDLDADQFTQEFQIASRGSHTIDWVAGLFFYREDSFLRVREEGSAARPAGSTVAPQVDFDGPGPAPAFNLPPGSLAAPTIATDRTTESYAGYVSVTWNITNSLALTGGLRYTSEQRDIVFTADNPAAVDGGIQLPLAFSRSFENVSWRGVLEYEPAERVLLYFSASTGFTAGDYNRRGANTVIFQDFLAPETITSYELGFKTDLLDRRLRLNGNVFQLDYDNFQTSLFDFQYFVFRRLNAGQLRYRGAELEATAALGGGFSTFLNIAYLDARYTQISPQAMSLGLTTAVTPQKTPEWQFGGGLQFEREWSNVGSFSASLSANYLDQYWSNVQNTTNALIDSHAVLNGRVAFTTSGGNFTFALVGRNLTDEAYLGNKVDIPALDVTAGTAAPPRTISFVVSARF